MTRITFQDGKVVLRDGQVGTEEACCCGGECECPNECVENLAISLGGNPECFGGFYSDFLNCAGGGISAVLQCNDGQWLVFVSVCCFENSGLCFASYEAVLECEPDNLPPAGAVDLTETGFFEDGGGCPPLPPTVTIIK
jgi:hypothetical protein